MSRKKRCIMLLLQLCLAISLFPCLASWAWSQEQVGRYEVLELTFTANQGGDPYTEKSINCSFTGTSGGAVGHNLTVGGFWDGGNTWRVRFSPSYTGTYSYATSSADNGLNGHTGTVTVSESGRRGRLMVDPQYPLYFQWSNGEPCMMIGDTWWNAFHTATNGPTDSEFNTAIDVRTAQKFNYAHILVWYASDDYLHGEQSFSNNDKDDLNPQFFQYVDDRVQYAAQKQFVTGILNGWADDGYWSQFSTTQSNRFSQYLINRYGAYPVLWSGVGEYDEGGNNSNWTAFADYYRANDPYDNTVTMHPTTGSGAMTEEGHLDYYTIQKYGGFFGDAVSARSKGMPFVNSEYGYEVELYNATDVLKYSWQLIMGGSAGLVYGNWDWYKMSDVSGLYSTGADYIQHLSEFWQEGGVEYWTFNSFSNLGSGRYEAKVNGGQHVYWTESTGSFNINLSDLSGSVPARWFNARTGAWAGEFYLSTGSSVQVTPSDRYYALLVAGDGIGNRAPSAAFSADPQSGVVPLAVDFDAAASSDPDGDDLAYAWTVKLGASTVATGSGIVWQHTFSNSGNFDVSLAVTDDGDPVLSDTTSRAIQVLDQHPPTASFTADPMSGTFPFPLQVDFDASASDDVDGSIVSYDWDFGDGGGSTVTNPIVSHVYASPGQGAIVVTLIVTDDDGATDDAVNSLDLYEQGGGGDLEVSNLSRANYQISELEDGDQYYVDRPYQLVSISSEYQDLLWIKTANDDKTNSSESFLTFTVSQDVTAYVAYDHRASSLPDWITDHYTETADEIGVGDTDASPLEVWARNYPAGQIAMGGNQASGASGAGSMYAIILRGRGAAPDSAAPLISQIFATDISTSGVTISWSTDELADSQVEYGLTTAYGSTSPKDTDLVTQHSIYLSGLSENALYHYRVRSADEAGNEAYSNDRTFQTAAAGDITPPQISAITVSDITQVTVIVSWSTDEPADSKVEYGLAPGSYTWSLEDSSLSLTRGLQLTGLSSATEYHFRVSSTDAWQNTSVSGDETFETAAGDISPPQIADVQVSGITDTTATISWSTDEPADSKVEYGLTPGSYTWSLEDVLMTQTHSFDLVDLNPGTGYHFRVLSKDESNNTGASGDSSFVTGHELSDAPGKPEWVDD